MWFWGISARVGRSPPNDPDCSCTCTSSGNVRVDLPGGGEPVIETLIELVLNLQVLLGNLWGAGMSRAYATETTSVGWLVPVGVQLIPAVLLLVAVPFCVGALPFLS